MSDSFFFRQAEISNKNSEFIRALESSANEQCRQTYVLNKPLGDSKYVYPYEGALIVLVPRHKIMILDFGHDSQGFEEFYLDIIEDLGALSDKFDYKSVIGRTRAWSQEIIHKISSEDANKITVTELLDSTKLKEPILQKKSELLISLLTGSINDIDKVKASIPSNLLEKIKQKIQLFDGDQTRFVYKDLEQELITIQGLSGTGKTELLLHKLKDLYVNKPDSKVLMTCHNKVLARSLKSRIPIFFNFMKVEQQIEWEQRLWCVHAWGSQRNENSGAYRYICHKYDIPFHRYSYSMSFSKACSLALAQLKKIRIGEAYDFAFDYILLDESQDFPKEFIELCCLVTRHSVYLAGDIFQSIFDENIVSEVSPDFLLSKCYRTDPRTLMFAHAIGMGLFESVKLRWLDDDQWEKCGYQIEKSNNNKKYSLSREPLRRFEDLAENDFLSMEIVATEPDVNSAANSVLSVIENIASENTTVTGEDIAIVFSGGKKYGFMLGDILESQIPQKFGWGLNKAYESKSSNLENTVFYSNKNNVKGLEFPFIICVANYISNAKHERNALYMLLTRSFLKSYLITDKDADVEKFKLLTEGLNFINKNNYMEVIAPTDEEKEQIRTNIEYSVNEQSVHELTEAVFDELDVDPIVRDALRTLVAQMPSDQLDYDSVKEFILINLEKLGFA